MALTPMKRHSLKEQARKFRELTLTVYFAARDERMPFLVRLLAMLVAAYALSPIDLIPDFIPVIGLLDDLILIPAGLALIVRLTPPEVIESAKQQAQTASEKPVSYSAAVVIVFIWLAVLWVISRWAIDVINA